MPLPAKPLLKWVGGKTQLLRQFEPLFPKALNNGTLTRYGEPFLGGGAVFFRLSQNPALETLLLSDINADLISFYRTVRDEPEALVRILTALKARYSGKGDANRKRLFYECRDEYNGFAEKPKAAQMLRKAALTLFLNKTCYNGLFRVNRAGLFNAPHGRYPNPGIFDEANVHAVSSRLRKADIRHCDFREAARLLLKDAKALPLTFVYLDPPYRPLSRTASFTAYSGSAFSEADQRDLAQVFRDLDRKGAKVMLSNSDPKNENPDDDFFDALYKGFNLRRVQAKRMINSKGQKRGAIKELVITNYDVPK